MPVDLNLFYLHSVRRTWQKAARENGWTTVRVYVCRRSHARAHTAPAVLWSHANQSVTKSNGHAEVNPLGQTCTPTIIPRHYAVAVAFRDTTLRVQTITVIIIPSDKIYKIQIHDAMSTMSLCCTAKNIHYTYRYHMYISTSKQFDTLNGLPRAHKYLHEIANIWIEFLFINRYLLFFFFK